MNNFRDDLLIILKKLKYKYEARFFIDKPEDSVDYPFFKIKFTEEEIKSYGVDINSISSMRAVINDLLEIPDFEKHWGHDVSDEEIYKDNHFSFTISPNINSVINFIESNITLPSQFNETKSTLIIRGIPFSLSRKNQFANVHYIFKYIFEHNPKEEHFYSDMKDENILGDETKSETYYKALNKVREKLIIEQNIDDFFEKISTGNKGSVKINNKYL